MVMSEGTFETAALIRSAYFWVRAAGSSLRAETSARIFGSQR